MVRRESDSHNDLVARFDSLEPLERLSLLVQPYWAEDRLMSFMICSYADESGDTCMYSVCGLLGKLADFVELGRRWRNALNEESIPEFHASQLEFNKPPYDDLKVFNANRRAFLQRKFIGLITNSPIWGFNAFVEIASLKAHEAELKPFMSHTEPYAFSFRMLVELMAIDVDDYKVKNEPIAFVFDRQKQYEGKAKEIYDHLSTDGKWPLAYRLGSITFACRFDFVELQAADVWAYESRKYVTDTLLLKRTERWQMTLFKEASRFNVVGYPEKELCNLIARLQRGESERPQSTFQRRLRRLAGDTL